MVADHASILQKKLIFVSGKGGVGKSLVSACLAQHLAAQGKRVLIVEETFTEQISPLFGHSPIGHEETLLSEGIWGINLSPKMCFQEYVVKHLGLVALYNKIFENNLVKTFINAIPGLLEVMILGRLFHACELRSAPYYDTVIFDAPASGHFLNLLSTPQIVMNSGLMGPLVKEIERVFFFLKNEQKCGIVWTTLLEELVVQETLDFLPQLQKSCPTKLIALFANRTHDFAFLEQAILENPLPKSSIKAYCSNILTAQTSNLKKLETGLQKIAPTLPFFCLPELNIVKEPLDTQIYSTLLRF